MQISAFYGVPTIAKFGSSLRVPTFVLLVLYYDKFFSGLIYLSAISVSLQLTTVCIFPDSIAVTATATVATSTPYDYYCYGYYYDYYYSKPC